jgi:hypothetical protein
VNPEKINLVEVQQNTKAEDTTIFSRLTKKRPNDQREGQSLDTDLESIIRKDGMNQRTSGTGVGNIDINKRVKKGPMQQY